MSPTRKDRIDIVMNNEFKNSFVKNPNANKYVNEAMDHLTNSVVLNKLAWEMYTQSNDSANAFIDPAFFKARIPETKKGFENAIGLVFGKQKTVTSVITGKTIEINFRDFILNGLTKLFLKELLSKKGSIINISSVIGYAPVIGRTAYAASKFGMEGFFSVLAAEWEQKLHIMMVYPTFIATHIRENTAGKQEVNEILTPEVVSEQIFKAFQSKKESVYIGKTAKLSKLMYNFSQIVRTFDASKHI